MDKEKLTDAEVAEFKSKLLNGDNILLSIIAETLGRDRGKSEEEMKIVLGADENDPRSEAELTRIAIANLLIKKTKSLIKLKENINNNLALWRKIMEKKEFEDGRAEETTGRA